jgi:putative ABC transport system permease protein
MNIVIDTLRGIRREPMRFALTLVGIVVGAASIVFLASALHGANFALAYASQNATGADITRVTAHRPPPGSQGVAPGLSSRDARVLRASGGGGEAVASSTLYHREASVAGAARSKHVGIQSGGAAYASLTGLVLVHGHFPRADEENARVCVIGYNVWQDLFGGAWPLKQALIVDQATRLEVVGVLASKPPMGGGDGDGTWRIDRQVFVTNTLFERDIAPVDAFDEIAFRHAAGAEVVRSPKVVATELLPVLLNLHRGILDFEFDALSEDADLDTLITLALSFILVGCGVVSTLVGGVNVMSAQLVTVQERTREYGIRRALGISAGRLARDVVLETLLLTCSGSVLGVWLGIGGAWAVAASMSRWVTPWPFAIVPWAILGALSAGIVAGLFASYVPARSASRLAITECLRSA